MAALTVAQHNAKLDEGTVTAKALICAAATLDTYVALKDERAHESGLVFTDCDEYSNDELWDAISTHKVTVFVETVRELDTIVPAPAPTVVTSSAATPLLLVAAVVVLIAQWLWSNRQYGLVAIGYAIALTQLCYRGLVYHLETWLLGTATDRIMELKYNN